MQACGLVNLHFLQDLCGFQCLKTINPQYIKLTIPGQCLKLLRIKKLKNVRMKQTFKYLLEYFGGQIRSAKITGSGP